MTYDEFLSDNPESQAALPIDTAPDTGSGFLKSFGGFISKAAETALDVYSTAAKAKIVGSVYPTGQTNPAQLSAAQQAAQAADSASMKKILLIGGGVLAAVLVVVLVTRRNK